MESKTLGGFPKSLMLLPIEEERAMPLLLPKLTRFLVKGLLALSFII